MMAAADPMPGWTGRTLGGRYLIERVVGQGGFGVVFRARHLVLDAPVAIKALQPARLQGEMRERLVAATMREAQLLARLRHPAIVSVLDGGFEDDPGLGIVPWFAMEWCEGITLEADLASRRGRGGRTLHEAFALLRPVLEGVAYGHAQGIAHRDIKPANVVLARAGDAVSARVLDFGLAKKLGEDEQVPMSGATQTTSADRAYTPAYAAPEQIGGGRTGAWTDVHALGLLISEVLIDRPCYATDTFYLTANDPTRPTPGKFGIDAGPWEAPLRRAMALHPAERFATAGELLDALAAALGQHVTQPSPGAPQHPFGGTPPLPGGAWGASGIALTAPATPSQGYPAGPPAGGTPPPWPAPSQGAAGITGPPVVTAPVAPNRGSALAIVAIVVGVLALVGVGGIGWMLWNGGADGGDGDDRKPKAAAPPAGAALRHLTVDQLAPLVEQRMKVTTRTETPPGTTYRMWHLTVDDGPHFGGVTLYVTLPGISVDAIAEAAKKSPGVLVAKDANALLQVSLYDKSTGKPVDATGLFRHILASYPGQVI
jgi:hypothetical protein